MALRDRMHPGTVEIWDGANDSLSPFVAVRTNGSASARVQGVVAPESACALFVENGADTYDFDVLLPAGALITGIFVHAIALWDAATSASLDVGDYNTDGTTARDADGFFTATNLKATDLTAGQSISLLGAGAGGEAGAYNSGTNTHWDKLYSADARILRFRVVSVGAGTAGRTFVAVTYIHAGETLTTVTT